MPCQIQEGMVNYEHVLQYSINCSVDRRQSKADPAGMFDLSSYRPTIPRTEELCVTKAVSMELRRSAASRSLLYISVPSNILQLMQRDRLLLPIFGDLG